MDVKKLILILLLCLAEFASAQSFNLKGRITNSENGWPIQGVTVFISHNYVAYSNAEGYYSITKLSAGKYQIKVSSLGYNSVSTEVEINSDDVKDFALTPSPIELDEVVVSTNRTENYLRNSPFAESIVGKEEIQTRSTMSLPDILQNEPGVSLLRDGIWGTEVSIRGLNRENVITMIDGSRIATSTDVAARLSLMNMNDVERVEVIKGASSSIYGSGATGGIVNIITKSPQLYDRFTLNGDVITEYNTVNNLSVLGGSLYSGSSLWSTKLSGSYRKANNIQTPDGELNNSQFEDYSFSGALNNAA